MKVTLSEALLRRKELQEKVDQVRKIKEKDLYEIKAKRVNVTDNVDEFIAQVPKLTLAEVTKEFDYYAKQLRLIDAAIQQANWSTEIEVKNTMEDYKVEETDK